MPFNGSGVFQRVRNWVADATAGVKIRADYHDAEDDGFATGLTNCITKDGQTIVTQNIPFNSKRVTGLQDPVNPQDAATKAYADTKMPLAGGTMTGPLDEKASVTAFGYRTRKVWQGPTGPTGSTSGCELTQSEAGVDGLTTMSAALPRRLSPILLPPIPQPARSTDPAISWAASWLQPPEDYVSTGGSRALETTGPKQAALASSRCACGGAGMAVSVISIWAGGRRLRAQVRGPRATSPMALHRHRHQRAAGLCRDVASPPGPQNTSVRALYWGVHTGLVVDDVQRHADIPGFPVSIPAAPIRRAGSPWGTPDEYQSHGNWHHYRPSKLPKDAPANAMFARREGDGADWYDYVNSGK